MELGEKLRNARIEAGLSQRALCGEIITRNMLSQIEHGTARPSMDTLRELAARLGKPVSFFLDENVVASPNQEVMESARRLYDAGQYAAAVEKLVEYRAPDTLFDRERNLLLTLARIFWAEELLSTGREKYALEILEHTETSGLYCAQGLERRRRLLLARLQVVELPSLDEELLLRADMALRSGDGIRAGCLLDAAENQNHPRWQLLRGKACLGSGDFRSAAGYLRKAEPAYPEETAPCLETCYRELGDFKLAYEYACKQRKYK